MKIFAATIAVVLASSAMVNAQTFSIGLGNGIHFGMQNGQPHVMVNQPVSWSQPPVRPVPPRHSVPVHVTQNQATGINPWTGGVNTQNTQINNTALDFGRNASRHNGTARQVNRPVHDQWGRVIGYERGVTWRNSFTGQEHKNTEVVTPNGVGGTHTTRVAAFEATE